jgi:hypothetical protein
LYRQQGQVKLLPISLASLAACAVLAAPAHAETGNGLYEPFPSPTSGAVAQEFLGSLPHGLGLLELNGFDIERGVLVGAQTERAYKVGTAPMARASASSGFAPSFGWPLAVVLLAVALGGAGLVAVRRR